MKVKIKEQAEKKGWTVYKLAREMKVFPQTVYSWVKGRTFPKAKDIDLMCETLNCTVGDLFEADIQQGVYIQTLQLR